MVNHAQQALLWENESLDLREKYSQAHALYLRHGQQLQDKETIARLLAALRRATDTLAQWMKLQQLGILCSSCAAKPNGSCCSSYMGNNTDLLQLLSNMLLGCFAAPRTVHTDCCAYLGPKGCAFIIKPIFCLNYNCTHICNHLDSQAMQELTRLSGNVLQLQVALEEQLLENIPTFPRDLNQYRLKP